MPSSTGALIGITSALLDKWFAPKNYKEEYFIGHKVAVQYGWVIMYLSHNNFSKLFAIVAVLTNIVWNDTRPFTFTFTIYIISSAISITNIFASS